MEISGLVKDAKTDTPLPGARVSLYIGAEELAVIPSDDRGEFRHSVEASYIGKTLTCRVEKEGYKTKKETKKVEQDEVHLEIELTPEIVPDSWWERLWKWLKQHKIAVGIAAAVVVVVIVICCLIDGKKPSEEKPNLKLVRLAASPTKARGGTDITLKYELALERTGERELPDFNIAATFVKKEIVNGIAVEKYPKIRPVGRTARDLTSIRLEILYRYPESYKHVRLPREVKPKQNVPIKLDQWKLPQDRRDELESNGKITDTRKVQIPSGLKSGSWFLSVRADVDRHIKESNEGDNAKYIQIEVVD